MTAWMAAACAAIHGAGGWHGSARSGAVIRSYHGPSSPGQTSGASATAARHASRHSDSVTGAARRYASAVRRV